MSEQPREGTRSPADYVIGAEGFAPDTEMPKPQVARRNLCDPTVPVKLCNHCQRAWSEERECPCGIGESWAWSEVRPADWATWMEEDRPNRQDRTMTDYEEAAVQIEARVELLRQQGYSEDYAWQTAQDEVCPPPRDREAGK